ncbi:MAG: M23 family metallopeptidase [Candidatus Peribacteraceae bacterium]|nr:M23 family metallopeptidase [Candidatus Peribacteraceae bacterium]
MEIRIHLPRPLLTLTIVIIVALFWTGVLKVQSLRGDSAGEGGVRPSIVRAEAVQDIDRERVRQAVFDHQEEILRYQLQVLEDQALRESAPEKLQALRDTRAALLSVISQRTHSEGLLRASLEEIWEAEGTSFTLGNPSAEQLALWPVNPSVGLSATFLDAGYERRFGIPHHAIDIPVPQGTFIRAPADATVLKVALNGLGYSYIVLSHADGMQTVFGHITAAHVEEGATVETGQVIGETGGQPGTAGAGLLTTGPHLHFAMKINGALVDPLKYLPQTRVRE